MSRDHPRRQVGRLYRVKFGIKFHTCIVSISIYHAEKHSKTISPSEALHRRMNTSNLHYTCAEIIKFLVCIVFAVIYLLKNEYIHETVVFSVMASCVGAQV